MAKYSVSRGAYRGLPGRVKKTHHSSKMPLSNSTRFFPRTFFITRDIDAAINVVDFLHSAFAPNNLHSPMTQAGSEEVRQ